MLELVAAAPQADGRQGDNTNKILDAGKPVLDRSDGNNGRAAAWVEGDDQETPDQQNGDDANRQGYEEPRAPTDAGMHVLERDDVLRRGNWRRGSPDIGGESNSQDNGFRKPRVRRKISQEWLDVCQRSQQRKTEDIPG